MRPQVQPGPVMILQFFIIFNPRGFIHYFVAIPPHSPNSVKQRNMYLILLKLYWVSSIQVVYLCSSLTAISIDGVGECQEVGSNVKLSKRKFSNCPKCPVKCKINQPNVGWTISAHLQIFLGVQAGGGSERNVIY